MNSDIIKINSLKKLKLAIYFEIIIGIISVVILILCNVNMILNITLNIMSTILTIIIPFICGVHYTRYNSQIEAIDELSEIIINLWGDACELENHALNDKNDKRPIAQYLQKEVSIFYILGVFFDNLHWYNHELYNLPIDIKETIKEICIVYPLINSNLTSYKTVSYLQFKESCYFPISFTHSNTQYHLKNFLEIVIYNTSEKYSKKLEEIKTTIVKFKNYEQ